VLDRIAVLKRPLYSGLLSATVHKSGGSVFTVALNDFFARRLQTSDADVAMIKAVIAEREGCSADDITLKIQSKDKASGGAISEIENALK
jgi:hypothetical protein